MSVDKHATSARTITNAVLRNVVPLMAIVGWNVLTVDAGKTVSIAPKNSECDASREECCWDSDCRKKCSDGVCRGQCLYCVTSSECGAGECCDDNGDCKLDCTVHVSLTHAGIAGIVVACAVVVAIVVSIIACFCCACCPYYRSRHDGTTVLVGSPATGYHQFVSTASSQQIAQVSQPLPQIGPYAAHQDQEPSPRPPPSALGVHLGPYPQQ